MTIGETVKRIYEQKAVEKMPEHLHYVFKRAADTAVARPRLRNRGKERKLVASQAVSAVLLSAFFLISARAQILGGLHPFAPACFAAAAVVWPRRGVAFAIPVLLGLSTVVTAPDLLVYAAVIAFLGTVLVLYPSEGDKQWIVVPVIVAASVLVCKGLFIALTSFTDYKLLVTLFESLLSAGFSLVYLIVLTASRRFEIARRFSADETTCIFLALIGFICGFFGLQIGTVNVQSAFSRLIIITVAYLGGGGAGAAVGALIGLVPSLSQMVSPFMIATYAFSGLLAGIFGNFGRIGSAAGFILGDLILSLYFLDTGDISSALAASATASLIFLIIPGKAYKVVAKSFTSSGIKSEATEKNERMLRIAQKKLRSSGDAFKELSDALSDLAGKEAVSEDTNVRSAMEQLSHQLCSRCSLRDICWEIDYHDTFRGIVSLFESVRDHGLADIKDAPDNFTRRCPHIGELIAIVNCLYDLYCRSNYWQQQRISCGKLITGQLAGMTEIIDALVSGLADHGEEREILERELRRAVSKRGLPIENAGINTVNDRSIEAWAQYVECPGETYCRQAMEDEIGRLLGKRYKVHGSSCGCVECGCRCSYRLLAVGAHSISVGKAQLTKSGRDTCGDSGGCIMLDDGRQLLLVSDGMGSGPTAARESAEAISLVAGLVKAGFKQDTAIDVVNAVLSLRGGEESFVTLDICLVDLYSCAAEFIKTGASTSYIKRGSAVTAVKGSTLPVGMLYNVDKEVVFEHIMPGDMIILASDGLLGMDMDGEGAWLSRVIGEAVVNNPQAMAEYLLDKVISVSNGKIKDDITVLVAQMGEVA